jgi:hypothetical protein
MNAYGILVGKLEGKRRLGRLLHVGRRIILKWVSEKLDGLLWTRIICIRLRTRGGVLQTW